MSLDIKPGDIVILKKNHPCGSNEMYVVRCGMELKLRCCKCSREFMVLRSNIEKKIKNIKKSEMNKE